MNAIKADCEQIVLLDKTGKPIASAPKLASHHAKTPLHLGFSVYIFNANNLLLVTQRALTKKVWGGVWTNSCCGHPKPGEVMERAVRRRVLYELGMHVQTLYCVLPNYQYKTPLFNGVIENEICPVFFGSSTSNVRPHNEEVNAYTWMTWQEFMLAIKNDHKNKWSWWCKDQAKLLNHM